MTLQPGASMLNDFVVFIETIGSHILFVLWILWTLWINQKMCGFCVHACAFKTFGVKCKRV